MSQDAAAAERDRQLREKAVAEWGEVEKQQAERAKASTATAVEVVTSESAPPAPAPTSQQHISHAEAVGHLRHAAETLFGAGGAPAASSGSGGGGLAAKIKALFGPPKLKETLVHERDVLVSIAKVPLRPATTTASEPAQTAAEQIAMGNGRILEAVFSGLTGKASSSSGDGGGGWEEIGFQGADPGTDLRGVGMLGAVHMLALATKHSVLAKALQRLSSDTGEQRFPLAATLLNVTRFVLEATRDGALHKLFNTRASVLVVADDVFCAASFDLYMTWFVNEKNGHLSHPFSLQALLSLADLFVTPGAESTKRSCRWAMC
jgi:hypothetical protein